MSVTWEELIEEALESTTTPFYLSAWQPVEEALRELRVLGNTLLVRHWLSFKTHPIAPLVRQWKTLGLGVEVVSECEFVAACHEGFAARNILINGVAKHSWLPKYGVKDIYVNFDSLAEVNNLARQALELEWRIGLRCHVAEERDQDDPRFGGQFGLNHGEIGEAVETLRRTDLSIKGLHFHLGTNLPGVEPYDRATSEIIEICKELEIEPGFIDFGGGLPVPGEPIPGNVSERRNLDLTKFHAVFTRIRDSFTSEPEIWFENGRFLTARSAILVARVLDIKERPESRYLICDGGRTNHALVSDWESHDVMTIPERSGKPILTTICGPSCMAFDRLDRRLLPSDTQIGDLVVWKNAGAYHIPWETRFSRGLAGVVWCDSNGQLAIARDAESCEQWWHQWK